MTGQINGADRSFWSPESEDCGAVARRALESRAAATTNQLDANSRPPRQVSPKLVRRDCLGRAGNNERLRLAAARQTTRVATSPLEVQRKLEMQTRTSGRSLSAAVWVSIWVSIWVCLCLFASILEPVCVPRVSFSRRHTVRDCPSRGQSAE